jgi:hypothetical protein
MSDDDDDVNIGRRVRQRVDDSDNESNPDDYEGDQDEDEGIEDAEDLEATWLK